MECATILEDLTIAIPVKIWFQLVQYFVMFWRNQDELRNKCRGPQNIIPAKFGFNWSSSFSHVFWRDQDKMRNQCRGPQKHSCKV